MNGSIIAEILMNRAPFDESPGRGELEVPYAQVVLVVAANATAVGGFDCSVT
jgi:hypothetical protein